MPQEARDPTIVATALAQALQSIVSRNVHPIEPAVLSITQIHAGSAYNVIPEHAALAGTIRAFSDEVRATIRDRVRTIATGTAIAFDVEITVDIRDIFTVLENSEEHAVALAEVARAVVGEDKVLTAPRPMMGSEDFADMLRAVPGAYCWLGHSGDVPLHNPGYVFDDTILSTGASLFARLVETRLPAV